MSTGKITPNNILHLNRKKQNKITLDNLLEISSTDNVSDAMKNLYGKQGLIKDIKPINPASKVVGKIRTVETNSDDWGTCIKGIYAAKPGEILFIKCSDDEHAVWGEMASQAAKKHGLKATVIYGISRDTEDILKLNYPVFSKGLKSRAGLPSNKGTVNSRLILDDNVIVNGDLLVGDRDGVVIIPQEKINEVLEEVNNIKKFESKCIKELLDKDEQLDLILGIK